MNNCGFYREWSSIAYCHFVTLRCRRDAVISSSVRGYLDCFVSEYKLNMYSFLCEYNSDIQQRRGGNLCSVPICVNNSSREAKPRQNVYWRRPSVCLCVCLSLAAFPHYCTDPGVSWGNGRRCGCPLLGTFAIGARISLLWQHSAERDMSTSACTRSMLVVFLPTCSQVSLYVA